MEFLKNNKLASVAIVVAFLWFGTNLLTQSNTFTSPAGVFGAMLIVAGLLFGSFSYLSTDMREKYESLISSYQKTIETLAKGHAELDERYKGLSPGASSLTNEKHDDDKTSDETMTS